MFFEGFGCLCFVFLLNKTAFKKIYFNIWFFVALLIAALLLSVWLTWVCFGVSFGGFLPLFLLLLVVSHYTAEPLNRVIYFGIERSAAAVLRC